MVKESSRDRESSKKKKKSTAQETDNETDLYKKVVEFEEKTALSRSADEDANIYINICQEIKKHMTDIFQLKTQKNSDNKEIIAKKCTDACIKIAILKKLNRMEKFRLVSAKEGLLTEKQKVDSINLQFQNLLYEANHVVNEFQKCFQFKSKDEDIELVSIKEFLKQAPAEITEKFKNYDENEDTIKHELRLARLEWELQQRKNLAKLCKTLEEEKKKIGQDIIDQKKKLDGLAPRLNAVLEATRPLQEHLNMPVEKIQAEHKLACLLPTPLYLFYINLDGYRQVYNSSIEISIIGDSEEANQWNERDMQNDNDEGKSDEELELDSEDVIEVKKRRHRKASKTDQLEEKKKKLLQSHPLSVQVSLNLKDGFNLKFQLFYYVNLKIIAVKSSSAVPTKITGNSAREVLMGENIFSELIDGDTGKESPNSSTLFQLKNCDLGSFESLIPDLGYAYSWAQRTCGLDFLTHETSKAQMQKMSQCNVEIVMKTLQRKVKSRYLLSTQLEQLERNQIPKVPDSVDVPNNIISTLTKWGTKNYQQFCSSPGVKNLLDEELVTPNDLFYCATITRNTAILEVLVVIKNSYPLQPPILNLTLNYYGTHHAVNNENIRDMERSINTGWPHNFSTAEWILAAQITFTCAYLDVYLETEYPDAFPQNVMFLKRISGRNRRKPFHYRKIGRGLFTQE